MREIALIGSTGKQICAEERNGKRKSLSILILTEDDENLTLHVDYFSVSVKYFLYWPLWCC